MMTCGYDDQGNTVYLGPKDQQKDSNGRRYASFSCSGATPTCYVYDRSVDTIDFDTQSWRTSDSCTPTITSCGNGVVES